LLKIQKNESKVRPTLFLLATIAVLSSSNCQPSEPDTGSGRVAWRGLQTPCGEQIPLSTSPLISPNYTFTGYEKDKALALLDAGARMFNATTCRFMGIDPIDHSAMSSYAYAANNPIKYVDPDGKQPSSLPFNAYWLYWLQKPAVRAGMLGFFRDQLDYWEWVGSEIGHGNMLNAYRLLTEPAGRLLTGKTFQDTYHLIKEAVAGETQPQREYAQGYLAAGTAVAVGTTVAGKVITGKINARLGRQIPDLKIPNSGVLSDGIAPAIPGEWTLFEPKLPLRSPVSAPGGWVLAKGETGWILIDETYGTTTGANGYFDFVRIGDTIRVGAIGHDQLSGMKSVYYAGKAKFTNGDIEFWNNASGQYQPSADYASQAGLPMNKFRPDDFRQ